MGCPGGGIPLGGVTLRQLDVASVASGGSGTADSPYVGWESAVNSQPPNTYIYFSPGFYQIRTGIIAKSGWVIAGVGETSVVVSAPFVSWLDTGFIQIYSTNNVEVWNLVLNGNKSSNPTGRSFGVDIRGSDTVRVINVRSINHPGSEPEGVLGGDGFYISPRNGVRSSNIHLRGVIADGNVRQGLSIAGGAQKVIIANSQFINTTGSRPGAGIDLEPDSSAPEQDVNDVTITGCIFSGNSVGFYVANSFTAKVDNIVFVGNVVRNNRTTGVRSIPNSPRSPIVIANNTITDNQQEGISLQITSSYTINGNFIANNGYVGIRVTSEVQNESRLLTISNNVIALNGQHGVHIDYFRSVLTGATIVGNIIANNGVSAPNTYYGIWLNSGVSPDPRSHVIVAHNWIGNWDALGAPTQLFGLRIQPGTPAPIVSQNVFQDNLSANIVFTGSINTKIFQNFGFVSENGGLATIPSGSFFVTVTHGLDYTPAPQEISLILNDTTTNDIVRYWVSNITATTFQINVAADPGASGATFAWQVRRL
jgi:hypothetical protein